ncbi:MAG: acylglycerol kinase family protein, partial [Alistipes sp.]|nr:acylglycerol kinase family protein [Alistipes sp.]
MQRVLFLYNGNSGRGDILRHKEQICAILSSRGVEVAAEEICFGRNPFDGHDDIDTVVVAGGDGTLNYVVNAMATSGRNLAIGIIP